MRCVCGGGRVDGRVTNCLDGDWGSMGVRGAGVRGGEVGTRRT